MSNKIDKNTINDGLIELKKTDHLQSYDLLKSTANWLENPDNEFFALLEDHDDSLEVAARACVIAAALLKKAAFDIQVISGIEDTNKYEPDIFDAIENLKSVANELDASGDEKLMKQATMLDDILLTVTSSAAATEKFKKDMALKLEKIKSRASDKSSSITLVAKDETEDKDTSSNKKKDYRPLQTLLSSRQCPDHPGNGLIRISDGVYQCSLDKKEYDFVNGYTLMNGRKVPGSCVENQTDNLNNVSIPAMFNNTKK